jgi:hypothetical protein
MFQSKRDLWLALSILLLAGVFVGITLAGPGNSPVGAAPRPDTEAVDSQGAGDYIVLAWNDLGMHCYNRDFQDLAVLPPFNTLWAQVIRLGDPPRVVTQGIEVTFLFTDNTYSVGKSNFWEYDQQLFGVDLPPDIGLMGVGLSGTMEVHNNYFEALGIPLTEFRDSAPTTPYPYQVATVIVKNAGTGEELARTHPVAPVSTEMHCEYCHYDNGPGNPGVSTGVVEQNILTQHDLENLDEYPPGHEGPLMARRPILCAECHASNALGEPGAAGVPNLSNAVHDKHDGEVEDTLDGCYSCHPGPQTQCLRDVMSSPQFQLYCVDCHGTMLQVSNNPNPWFNEPRCDDNRCHGNAYQQDQALYRLSKEHGGVYCAGCHDSPHAIAPSRESNDDIKFIGWQGRGGPLNRCTSCHTTWPTDPGPHGLVKPPPRFIYLPLIFRDSPH